MIKTTERPGPIRELVLYFLRLGLPGFGGPVALVGQMERELVTERCWLSPGPVVITATFVGYLVAGFWGAVAATVGIFLPSFILVLVVAIGHSTLSATDAPHSVSDSR